MGILADVNKWVKKVEFAIPYVLKNEVATVVTKDFMYIAQTAVYGSYSPKYYLDGSVFGRERRFAYGGIYDLGMINSRMEGRFTLVMENIAPANTNHPSFPNSSEPKNAVDWIESGFNVPERQFYKPLEALAVPHAHEALVSGLHRRGL